MTARTAVTARPASEVRATAGIVVGALLVVGLLLAGCADSDSARPQRAGGATAGLYTFGDPHQGGATGNTEAGPGCTGGQFENDPRPDLVSGKSPQEAVVRFFHDDASSEVADSGFPSGGWHQIRRDRVSATFKSGRSAIHLEKFTDYKWRVISGEQCA